MKITNKFQNELNLLNTERDIVTMIVTVEKIVERINIIEQHLEQEIGSYQQNVKKNKNMNFCKQRTNRKILSSKPDQQDRRWKSTHNYAPDRRKSKNHKNQHKEKVAQSNHPPVHNHKEEVESINQILSREIVKMSNKNYRWYRYEDDQKVKNRQPVDIQNNWATLKRIKGWIRMVNSP